MLQRLVGEGMGWDIVGKSGNMLWWEIVGWEQVRVGKCWVRKCPGGIMS